MQLEKIKTNQVTVVPVPTISVFRQQSRDQIVHEVRRLVHTSQAESCVSPVRPRLH